MNHADTFYGLDSVDGKTCDGVMGVVEQMAIRVYLNAGSGALPSFSGGGGLLVCGVCDFSAFAAGDSRPLLWPSAPPPFLASARKQRQAAIRSDK